MGPIPDFRGEQVVEGDAAYDDARTVFNAMVDRRPALIARCADEDDVARRARVRAGGWTRRRRARGRALGRRAQPQRRRRRDRRAGARRGHRRRAAPGGALRRRRDVVGVRPPRPRRSGWRPRAGACRAPGVAGLTLGGGSGWLERLHGLACDNLLASTWSPRRRARPRERGREPGAVLGAARRRRQLRRRRPRSSSGCTRSARWSTAGSRCSTRPTRWRWRPRSATSTARPRRGRAGARVHHHAARAVRPARVAGPRDGRDRRHVGRRAGGRRGRAERAARSRAAGRQPVRRDALRRVPVDDRRPARHAELVDGRVPRRAPRRGGGRVLRLRREHARQLDPAAARPVGRRGRACRGRDAAGQARRRLGHPPVRRLGGRRAGRRARRVGPRGARALRAVGRPAASTSTSSATRARTACARRSAPAYDRLAAVKAEWDPGNVFHGNQNILPARAGALE